MAYPLPADNQRFTYADRISWPENERWELIDGVAYDMTPAPTQRHQEILGELYLQFHNFLSGSPCRVLFAPFDVLLPKASEEIMSTSTIVQPDLLVVCEREKLDGQRCIGSPTLVLEILSPHTSKKDLREKLHAYQQAGIPEYWVVFPPEEVVNVFSLNEQGEYGKPMIYLNGDRAPVGVLPGLEIDLERVFAV